MPVEVSLGGGPLVDKARKCISITIEVLDEDAIGIQEHRSWFETKCRPVTRPNVVLGPSDDPRFDRIIHDVAGGLSEVPLGVNDFRIEAPFEECAIGAVTCVVVLRVPASQSLHRF